METRTASTTPLFDFTNTPTFKRLASDLRAGNKVLVTSGLVGPAKAMLAAALHKELSRPIVLIVRTNSELETTECDLKFFHSAFQGSPKSSVLTLPAAEVDPYEGLSPHAEVEQKRAFALDSLARGGGELLIAPARALIERTPSPKQMLNLSIQLKTEEDYPLDLLVELLHSTGYLREEPISEIGTY